MIMARFWGMLLLATTVNDASPWVLVWVPLMSINITVLAFGTAGLMAAAVYSVEKLAPIWGTRQRCWEPLF